VADVAAGVGDGVELGLREGAEADQVADIDDDAGLLAHIAPGIRTRSEPTFCRSRHRYEPSNGIASADLEDAGA